MVISLSQAIVAACALTLCTGPAFITPVESSSVGFVYKDLLAHPQFHVQYLEEFIPASAVSAARRQSKNTHRQPKQQKEQMLIQKTGAETEELVRQDRKDTTAASPDDSEKKGTSTLPGESYDLASSIIMTGSDGQQWSCTIPEEMVPEKVPDVVKTHEEIEEEERQSVKRGLELLEPLSGRCLRTTIGYWTYEYCHKKHILQYHAILVKGQIVPEDSSMNFVMAVYTPGQEPQQAGSGSSVQKRLSLAAQQSGTKTELETSHERRYLVQRWENGAICDITGKGRQVEVQYQCANVLTDQIHVVIEPSICNYVMVIYSPRLCADLAFKNAPVPEANKINCRPIVSDEIYERIMASVSAQETIDGSADAIPFLQDESNGQTQLGGIHDQHQFATAKEPAPKDNTQNYAPQAKIDVETEPMDATSGGSSDQPLASKKSELGPEMEARIKQMERLDEMINVLDKYIEALKAPLTEDEKKTLEHVENALKGQDNQYKIFGIDQNGQRVEDEALVEALIGSLLDGNMDKDSDQPKEGEPKKKKKKTAEKSFDDTRQVIADAIAENQARKHKEGTQKNQGGKQGTSPQGSQANPRAKDDEFLDRIDIGSLLDYFDAKKAGAAGSAHNNERSKDKKKKN
ncbi:Protein OS-9 [Lunasporangiospora selenospora]|uniref:Protein OS-9 homolog n=1 Tax=Lunasporangiospora selenospora TaxID=979761 RepID=A0A9P6FPR6_9FUNG|nr:Protein OS-9 [Lunasporangiospora selenospora]